MKNLWAPWRKEFILGKKEKGCIFCKRLRQKKDKENLILFRGKKSFVILNRFPYNSGHLMVSPIRHVGKLEQLRKDELSELVFLCQKAVKIMKDALKPDGLNLGMNLERSSGAGIADHLHIHIVPRWDGDTNFMPVLTDTKLISLSLEDVYRQLKNKFDKIKL
jgi:ATP adenylyltransferase